MIRLAGYYVFIAATALAWLARDSLITKEKFLYVWFYGFPIACILDLVLRKHLPAKGRLPFLVRAISSVLWTPALLILLFPFTEPPEPLWRQGPDTCYAP